MEQLSHQNKEDKSVRNRVATNGEMLVAEHYEAPLPHPQILAEYDKVVPGSASAIIDDFKANAKAIRDLKSRELELTAARHARGQWMAFALGVLILGISAYSLHLGYPIVAGGACFLAVGSIGAAFLRSKK